MTRGASRGPSATPGRHRWIPADERLDDIAGRLAKAVDGLEFASARDLASQAAGGSAPLAWLHWHLRERPDTLTSGDSDVPLVVLRLINLLRDAGYVSVAAACCHSCGQAKRNLPLHVDGGRLCKSCLVRTRAEACSRCTKIGPVYGRDGTAAVCGRCWHHDPATWEPCGTCGDLAQVRARRPDGSAVGRCCFRGPLCEQCRKRRVTHAAGGGGLCERCRQCPERTCDSCAAVGPVVTTKRPALCLSCYRARSFGTCAGCGQRRSVSNCRFSGDKALCRSCWPRHRDRCVGCGHHRLIKVTWPMGAVCGQCYANIRRHPTTCPGCSDHQPLIGLDTSGTAICGRCCGVDFDYRCRRCHQPGYMIAEGICERCLVVDRARQLLTAPDGSISEVFDPFVQALAAADPPASMLEWLRPGRPAAALVAHLAARPDQISHELLDSLPQTLTLHRLRQTLIHIGVLADRIDYLERLGPWLESILADQPAPNAQLVRTYAHWSLLRRARQRSRRRPFTSGSAQWARTRLVAAIGLMSWIDAQGCTLGRLTQGDVDRWITSVAPSSAYGATEFLQWARRRHLTGELNIPKRQPRHVISPISEDERWQHLRRCLHDPTLPLEVRVAGALVLVYGIPVSRITTLRADQIHSIDGRVHLELGAHRLVLAPAIAGLLQRHQEQAVSVSVIHRSVQSGTTWLFPGGFPGRPATAILYRKLREHGIPHIRRARSAALITLAAELPAPVLADLLDIHISTAVQWAQHAQHDWAIYLAARTAAQTHTTQRDMPS